MEYTSVLPVCVAVWASIYVWIIHCEYLNTALLHHCTCIIHWYTIYINLCCTLVVNWNAHDSVRCIIGVSVVTIFQVVVFFENSFF